MIEFGYTGGAQSWTVPTGVSSIQVEAWGAQGGHNDYGGLGGYVIATIAVAPGESLQINVGGQPANQAGGFNGGGLSASSCCGNGFGGGGGTDVRQAGTGLANRVVVAGGGGGAGNTVSSTRGPGGSGGGLSGTPGERGTIPSCGATGGGGGTQIAGGTAGQGAAGAATDGVLGAGGTGGNVNNDGGGGGGGYYGGGGGGGCGYPGQSAAGGGGGSSYATPTASGVERHGGVRRGHGLLKITYPPTTPTPPSSPTGTLLFEFTGAAQWWTVPLGVTAVRIQAWGAQGGNANFGGLGGKIEATIPVRSGHALQITVGGQPSTNLGGFNGGGLSANLYGGNGFGGGGASDVRRGGVTLEGRVVVASGGGGASHNASSVRGPGGSGGGLAGGTGEFGDPWPPSNYTACATGGEGGTQTAGGNGGSTEGDIVDDGRPGEVGLGGEGGNFNSDGGGGGGGYYGGGGGGACGDGIPNRDGAGGGGGSSHASPDAAGIIHERGVRTGNGAVRITWPPPPTPPPGTPTPNSATFTYGGAPEFWTVPADVRAVHAVVYGAQGGSRPGSTAGNDGLGGYTEALLLVTPGEVLQVNVGGQAVDNRGGFNGGADADSDGIGYGKGWGGGGASDIRRGGLTLADRVIIAGGGGGQGGHWAGSTECCLDGAAGGAGGGLEGRAGGNGSCTSGSPASPGGGGGTQTGGGSGGTDNITGFPGTIGRGGDGGASNSDGGGGGGGLYGGGGGGRCPEGPAGGGGGGSGYADLTRAFDVIVGVGVRAGHGLITLNWPVSLPVDRAFGEDSYGEYVHKVHLGSGNFVEPVTDVEIATAGPDLELTRTYNSLDTTLGLFGKGWNSSYEIRAQLDSSSGNVTIVYADGRRELHKYGDGTFTPPNGYVSTLTNASGGGWRLTHKDKTVHVFNSAGQLTSVIDDYGRELTLTYDAGKLTRVTDAASGRYLSFAYTGARVTSVATPPVGVNGPLTWNYVYSADLLSKVCDARDPNPLTGKCTSYLYTDGKLTKITRPKGNDQIRLAYKPDGKVDWSEDGVGNRVTFAYGNGVTQVVDPRGYTTTYFFDPLYRTTRVIDPLGGHTVYEYDKNGFRSAITDPNGNRVLMTHDARGNMVSQVNGQGETTWFAYSGDNLVARRDGRSSSSSDNTYRTTFTYNTQGDVLTEVSALGITKTTTYTSGEDQGYGIVPPGLKKSESPGRGTTTFKYDANGDLRQRVDPSGLTTDFTYDAIGRPTAVGVTWESGSASTTIAYDQLGNIIQITEPSVTNTIDGMVNRLQTTYVYDDNANRIRMTLADVGTDPTPTPTRQTEYAYDGADRLSQIADPEGGVTSRVFDANSNVTRVTDPEGRIHEAVYDAGNHLTDIRLLGFVDDPIAGSTPRDVVLKKVRYDAAGRTIAEIEPQPGTGGQSGQLPPSVTRERWFAYDKADRLLTVTQKIFDNRDGQAPATRDIVLESYTYDAAGNRTTETTGGGLRAVTNAHDADSRLQSSILEMGTVDRVTEFEYDELENPTKIRVRPSNETTPTREERAVYDDAGRMTSRTVENGTTDLVTTFTYDRRGKQLSVVDPRGNVGGADPANFQTDSAYDVAGRLISTTLPPISVEENGAAPTVQRPVEKHGYDAAGNRIAHLDARGKLTQTTYDKLDRPTRIDHPAYAPPDGGAPFAAFEAYTYDRVGNVTSVRDRRGQITDHTFDKRNRVVRQLDPAVGGGTRGAIRYEYDDAGNRTALVDQIGARTVFTFDDLGRLRTESQIVRQDAPVGTFTRTFDYDDLGNETYHRDPAGVTLTRTLNAASELIEVADSLGKKTLFSYDAAGQQLSVKDPLSRTRRFVYDQAGRPIATEYRTDIEGTVLAREYATYDEAGNVTALRSARSSSDTDDTYKTSFTYDAVNRLSSVVEPYQGSTSFTTTFGYDASANLTRVTDGRGKKTIHTWNAWNLRESTMEPSTPGQDATVDRSYTTSYDAGGLAIKETVPGVAVPGVGGSPVTIARTFDELGRLTTETGTGTSVTPASRTFGWDGAGRLTSWSHPSGTVTAAYDDRSLILSTSAPGGGTTASSFRYDSAGRLSERADAAGSTAFGYTSRGEIDTIVDPLTGRTLDYSWNDAGQPSGVSYSGATATRTFTYNNRGWLESDTLADGATTLNASSYSYDDEGNVIGQTINAPGNPASGTHSYTYDRGGRLSSWTAGLATMNYAYDGAGNRIQAGSSTYGYDDRNRLTTAGTTSFSWTPRGTLSSVTDPTSVTPVEHDALGRLIGYGSTSFAYDALDRVATRGSETFAYAGGELDPVAIGTTKYGRTPAGELTSLQASNAALVGENRHGDLAWLLGAAGQVTDTRVYEPYGTVAGATGTTNPRVGFQGDYTDPASGLASSGLVWMGARWYHPAHGIFVSRDTVFGQLKTPISLNRYTYAFGDPMEFFDPDGRFGWSSFTRFASSVWNGFVSYVVRPVIRAAKAGVAALKSTVATATRAAGRISRRVVRYVKPVVSRLASGSKTALRTLRSMNIRRVVQTGLDIIGLVPVVGEAADLLNCSLHALAGNRTDAALSCAAAIPLVGASATALKLTRRVGHAADALRSVERLDDATDAFRSLDAGTGITSAARLRGGVSSARNEVRGLLRRFRRDEAGSLDLRAFGRRRAPQTVRASSGFIDPSEVRFTQNSISQTFRDGRSVSNLASGLRSGAIDPSDVPAIRLVEHEGRLFSLDNRRLAAFGDAGVNVPYRMATQDEIAREWASKFTTKTDGLSIQLRF